MAIMLPEALTGEPGRDRRAICATSPGFWAKGGSLGARAGRYCARSSRPGILVLDPVPPGRCMRRVFQKGTVAGRTSGRATSSAWGKNFGYLLSFPLTCHGQAGIGTPRHPLVAGISNITEKPTEVSAKTRERHKRGHKRRLERRKRGTEAAASGPDVGCCLRRRSGRGHEGGGVCGAGVCGGGGPADRLARLCWAEAPDAHPLIQSGLVTTASHDPGLPTHGRLPDEPTLGSRAQAGMWPVNGGGCTPALARRRPPSSSPHRKA